MGANTADAADAENPVWQADFEVEGVNLRNRDTLVGDYVKSPAPRRMINGGRGFIKRL
jgi:hypothetical protein